MFLQDKINDHIRGDSNNLNLVGQISSEQQPLDNDILLDAKELADCCTKSNTIEYIHDSSLKFLNKSCNFHVRLKK